MFQQDGKKTWELKHEKFTSHNSASKKNPPNRQRTEQEHLGAEPPKSKDVTGRLLSETAVITVLFFKHSLS